jgi:hypothetical protein
MSEVLSTSTPKARKRHQCYLCAKPIEVGSVYVRSSGVNWGTFWSIAMHVECEKHTRLWDDTDWETFSPGDLNQWIDEPNEVKR